MSTEATRYKQLNSSYFDLTITQIPFGWEGAPERRERCDVDDFVPVVVNEPGWVDWQHQMQKCGLTSSGCLAYVELSDNGKNGNGISFKVLMGDGHLIMETGIPDHSLGMLIEALTAIKRMRGEE